MTETSWWIFRLGRSRERGIQQQLTTANTPEQNAVAECIIAFIDSAVFAARLHAPDFYRMIGVEFILALGLKPVPSDRLLQW